MKTIGILENTVQNYAWGSSKAISDLLGKTNPSQQPQAELWMGAHPKAPSYVVYDGQRRSLLELIKKNPREILGDKIAARFDNNLPYLFKVLAAAKPLSIQAHPSLDQARKGFRKENTENIPLDAPNRNYKDENHKPECICALTPFWALFGFRSMSDIRMHISKICPLGLRDELEQLNRQPIREGLKHFFTALMTLDEKRKTLIIDETRQNAGHFINEDATYQWIWRLVEENSSDIGILSPAFLNLIELQPGQALYLPAGELHAYLEGVGIELMANSDNVLRGGLTPKHIDVPELLQVLHFESRPATILEAQTISKNERSYPSHADEFVLSVITVSDGLPYQSSDLRSVEIMLCTNGRALLEDISNQNTLELIKGSSVLVPAAVKNYRIVGNCTLYKAAVPI
ncbi:MAG: mannose-6-phosphate isomerase, class I [Desulfobacterales bacterium]|jgi:mannose-6-phosphate isomerase